MKILGISCSPRKGKSTYALLEECLKSASETAAGIETELVELAGLDISPCIACGKCMDTLSCQIEDDFRAIIPKVAEDNVAAMVVASPVYMGSMTAQCKAFLDRGVMFRHNDFILRNKVGGAIAVGGGRNGGQEVTIQAIHAAMMIQDMIIVGDGNDTGHFGGTGWNPPADPNQSDDFGFKTSRNLGRRVAQTAIKLGY